MADTIHDIPFSMCFTSPMKFQENIIQMEEAIERTGLSMEYHLTNTSPYVIKRAADAKTKASEQGRRILAIVRRKLIEVHENDEENISSDATKKHKDPVEDDISLLEATGRSNLETKMSLILQQLNTLTQKVERHELELNAFGSKKTVVVAALLSLETCILDWHIGSISKQRLSTRAMSVVSKGKKLTFYDSWWFVMNELVVPEREKFNIHIFWMSKLNGYKPTPTTIQSGYENDAKKWVIGTQESQEIAKSLLKIIHQAASYMIRQFNFQEITATILVESLGFFISVLRVDRNDDTHFLENLIKWPQADVEERKARRQKNTIQTSIRHNYSVADASEVSYVPFPYELNNLHVSKALKCLKAIQCTMDSLDEDWSLIKPNISWFCSAMLQQCTEVESSTTSP